MDSTTPPSSASPAASSSSEDEELGEEEEEIESSGELYGYGSNQYKLTSMGEKAAEKSLLLNTIQKGNLQVL